MPEKKKAGRPGRVLRLIIKAAALALAALFIFTFVLGIGIYHGNGMHPALKDGDLVIIWRLGELRAGDIVRYQDPETGEARYSRIAGLPGWTIEITEQGGLKTNGYVPNEEVFYRTAPHEGSGIGYPYEVPEGTYFLLDDYRTIGRDSRDFGGIKSPDGRAVFVVRRRGF